MNFEEKPVIGRIFEGLSRGYILESLKDDTCLPAILRNEIDDYILTYNVQKRMLTNLQQIIENKRRNPICDMLLALIIDKIVLEKRISDLDNEIKVLRNELESLKESFNDFKYDLKRKLEEKD